MKIAVTGGIGSGKSAALAIIGRLGYKVVSADEISAEITNTPEVLKKIEELFPGCAADGLDRKKLASRVFGDEKELKKLNGLLHPLIMQEVCNRLSSESIGFAEVPLLFEGGFENMFDKVIVVTRDREARIKSVMNRNNIDRAAVEARMARQIDYDGKDFKDFTVVKNNGTLENLEKGVYNALNALGVKV